jgi:hypothetical protein
MESPFTLKRDPGKRGVVVPKGAGRELSRLPMNKNIMIEGRGDHEKERKDSHQQTLEKERTEFKAQILGEAGSGPEAGGTRR